MEKLIKENIVYFFFVIFITIVAVFSSFNYASKAFDNFTQMQAKKNEVSANEQRLATLKAKNEPEAKEMRKAQSGKVIYEVPQVQFSADASFGIMFENVLANITNSGIRIRSIDYNYAPSEDPILVSNQEGYNACELSVTAIGTYTQLQNFFKSVAKEKYLSNLYEVNIVPYDYDKTILIAKFKLRLYTKSV